MLMGEGGLASRMSDVLFQLTSPKNRIFMNSRAAKLILQLQLCISILIFVGCGEAPPNIVPLSGAITLGGKPLSKAEVQFLPLAKGLDGSYVATGVTDEEGKFSLSLRGNKGPGCVACSCKVMIKEAPMPKEVRAAYNTKKHAMYLRYEASLKNRPIPKKYTSIRQTPLKFDVSAEQSEYNIEIDR